mgnify:CR=1 FL=1
MFDVLPIIFLSLYPPLSRVIFAYICTYLYIYILIYICKYIDVCKYLHVYKYVIQYLRIGIAASVWSSCFRSTSHTLPVGPEVLRCPGGRLFPNVFTCCKYIYILTYLYIYLYTYVYFLLTLPIGCLSRCINCIPDMGQAPAIGDRWPSGPGPTGPGPTDPVRVPSPGPSRAHYLNNSKNIAKIYILRIPIN